MIFAKRQAGFVRVIGNVLPQIFRLLRAAHEMVEWLLLPELALFADRPKASARQCTLIGSRSFCRMVA